MKDPERRDMLMELGVGIPESVESVAELEIKDTGSIGKKIDVKIGQRVYLKRNGYSEDGTVVEIGEDYFCVKIKESISEFDKDGMCILKDMNNLYICDPMCKKYDRNNINKCGVSSCDKRHSSVKGCWKGVTAGKCEGYEKCFESYKYKFPLYSDEGNNLHVCTGGNLYYNNYALFLSKEDRDKDDRLFKLRDSIEEMMEEIEDNVNDKSLKALERVNTILMEWRREM